MDLIEGLLLRHTGSGPVQTALAIWLHIFKNQYVAETLYRYVKEMFFSRWQPAEAPFQKTIDILDLLIDHRSHMKDTLEKE